MIRADHAKSIEKKNIHEEYIFGQWGLLIKYVILKGGKVEILCPRRKRKIDKRNQLDISFVEVEDQCYKAADIFQEVHSYVNQLCEKGKLKKRDKARTERKIVHDIIMNKLTQWCHDKSEKEGIKMKYRYGKPSYKKKEKERNLVIYEIGFNGRTYERNDIRCYFGNWMQKVLQLLLKKPKEKSITISQSTLPHEFYENFISPDYEENEDTNINELESVNNSPSGYEKNISTFGLQNVYPPQQIYNPTHLQCNRNWCHCIILSNPIQLYGQYYYPPQNNLSIIGLQGISYN
ncbi:hypothetical protein EHI8A_144660 [Entamoeba histolytica HM-1:IMSS-B]|uniref:Uncharacterized protein n=6 Tax=Entamoeba histolytica TaxID=5759 RepID=C4MBE5_ENTH1|nr:hypothetical protein EHI_187400 [Entamoeba histolytica HM-1:IMSS]EMD49073.1 Hypothetical protein EHI5A_161480 [Entamoeba histolytica KU27]EMH72015.1 hypothetical protein EHI8A_144660 [Entamoeba histolytica HM-1:IMSS-B]EMS14620.1 hypothetical protein KM1_191380 [Entamoeba histolytica HM-3:IMSS]ENY62457.1 hypothetical protein EHI7A_122850 [Entamoeba histolytica HM-1:IMSS-A]GAT99297.1 hypothetical protein CL6EHI_187400 [Entamoeba histolytica]|eukprot:XP_651742.1 hypothetical protein EHI_187400 [Entamoeba histolytica HM-1:IMSS]